MTQIIEVAFKGNRKDFFLWEQDEAPPLKRGVIVEADRGEDLGYVHATGDAALHRNRGTPHGYGAGTPTNRVRRVASVDDVRREKELRVHDEDARRKAAERVVANNLVMKVSDAEWQWDRKKLTLYFTAERRVDFRTLVRELAAMFRARIELKQIGVRDEAKRLDGIGRCGRQYCSSSWLPELRPVNLGVAKDQRLSLNPSQISGACGRLMCCLRYEHEFYVASRRRFPKEGKVMRTARGEEKVIANDIFRDRVVLRGGEDGELRTITLEELRVELDGLGAAFEAGGAGREATEELEELSDVILVETVDAVEPEVEVVAALLHTTSDDTEDTEDTEDTDDSAVLEAEAVSAAPSESVSGDAPVRDRRPHRRRGRRGGRKNRSGDSGGSAGEPPAPPKES